MSITILIRVSSLMAIVRRRGAHRPYRSQLVLVVLIIIDSFGNRLNDTNRYVKESKYAFGNLCAFGVFLHRRFIRVFFFRRCLTNKRNVLKTLGTRARTVQ